MRTHHGYVADPWIPDGRILDVNGAPCTEMLTIGWPMRGTLFETTAARELRVHAH